MRFGDKMKELASKAGEKAQDWGEKGIQASKELVSKAGAKAQNLGERGVLIMEIKQLEGQVQKLVCQLGSAVYQALVERRDRSIGPDAPEIKEILRELASLRESIEKKTAELEDRKE
ncbi:MAG: hypothetical protein LBT14_00445 [Treponema sp.]|jgi:hypothetical protein|nr:hypothetical protein [Treponema sp.]